jgi:hypothetical protein
LDVQDLSTLPPTGYRTFYLPDIDPYLPNIDLSTSRISTLPTPEYRPFHLPDLDLSTSRISTLPPPGSRPFYLPDIKPSTSRISTLSPPGSRPFHLPDIDPSTSRISTLPPPAYRPFHLLHIDPSTSRILNSTAAGDVKIHNLKMIHFTWEGPSRVLEFMQESSYLCTYDRVELFTSLDILEHGSGESRLPKIIEKT